MPRDDMIVRLSRRKDDVIRASDYQVLFSSQWPTLKVVESGRIEKGVKLGETIVNHRLGYRPFFLIWQRPIAPPIFSLGDYAIQLNNSATLFAIDRERLYLKYLQSGTSLGGVFYYAIFNLDLNKTFISEKANPGKSVEYNSKDKGFVFKVSSGVPADTNNELSNFSVNTDGQPILVDRVVQYHKTENVEEIIEFTHDLGYPPAFYLFGPADINEQDAPYYMYEIAPESFNGISALTTNSKIVIRITIPGSFTLVVLKDPVI